MKVLSLLYSLKQNIITFTHKNIVNIYMVYKINLWNHRYPVLENISFGAVRLTKNAHIDKYKFSGYGIGFDSRGTF